MTIPAPHDLDEVGFRRMARAQAKRANLAAPFEDASTLADAYGLATGQANLLLAEYGFPPDLRGMVDAIVGLCGNRHGEWFDAGDELLAKHMDRSTKTVQRLRPALIAWMKRRNVGLIDIEGHKYQKGEAPKPHRYRVNLSRPVAEATLEARNSPEWAANPGVAMEESARNVKDSIPGHVTATKRTKGRRGDAEARVNRNVRTAATLIRRALEIQKLTAYQVTVSREAIDDLQSQLDELRRVLDEQEGVFGASTIKEKALAKNEPPSVDSSPSAVASLPSVDSSEGVVDTPPGGSGHFVYTPP